MKKVVTIALFGDAEHYAVHLRAFVRAHLNLFPQREDWQLYVYIDPSVQDSRYGRFLDRLQNAGLVRVIVQPTPLRCRGMLWRMAPIFDYASKPDYVFCRDLDACPLPRDRKACEDFIRSGCIVHTILDAPVHFRIMGGLCGFRVAEFQRATGFRSLDDLCTAGNRTEEQWATHGTDQLVLNSLLLRFGGPSIFEHRYSGWKNGQPGPGAHPPGRYACGGISAALPNVGMADLLPDLVVDADRLANHLGAAGFDHEQACKFWDAHGVPEIMKAVAECEAAS